MSLSAFQKMRRKGQLTKIICKLVPGLFAFMLVIASVSQGQCASRFVEGFNGLAWGTHKDQLPPELGISKKAMGDIYESGPSTVLFMEGFGNLEMRLDDVPIVSMFLRFNDMIFYGVDMVFKEENAAKVIEIMEKELQSPGEITEDGLRWVQDGVTVVVTDRELMVFKN